MDIPGSVDLTNNSSAVYHITDGFRPLVATNYPIGSLLKFSAQDAQVYRDFRTVGPSVAVAADPRSAGIVADDWAGFDGNGTTLSAPVGPPTSRGTQFVKGIIAGYCPVALFDNVDATAGTTTDGTLLQSSKHAAGKIQGIATSATGAFLGYACLPAAGLGSSLGAGALAQATVTQTIAAPATGDVVNTVIQVPWTQVTPGTVATLSIPYTILSTDTTATIAAASIVVALNANATYKKYYVASSVAAVITHTVVATAPTFLVTTALNSALAASFSVGLSGTVGNSLTFTTTVTGAGGTTSTASAGTFSGGTGFVGAAPIYLVARI